MNGEFACENSHLIHEILKTEWGYAGFVQSDYNAQVNRIRNVAHAEPHRATVHCSTSRLQRTVSVAVGRHIRKQCNGCPGLRENPGIVPNRRRVDARLAQLRLGQHQYLAAVG